MKDRAVGVWVRVAGGVPWTDLQSGGSVKISGRIVRVRDARTLYVDAQSVQVVPAATLE